MSSLCHHPTLKKSNNRQQRRQRTKKNSVKNYIIDCRSTMKSNSFIERFRSLLFKMHQQNEPHLNLDDLESFYRETDIGLSLNKKMAISCPMICLFCEHFIYEPLTLYCGHTFCENCILKSEFRSIKKCPRCTKDVQGHIPSSIDYARSKSFNKNHFLNEIFDRSQTLKYIRQNSSLCCQAEAEFEKENYQRALEIFSMILENCKSKNECHHHLEQQIFFFLLENFSRRSLCRIWSSENLRCFERIRESSY